MTVKQKFLLVAILLLAAFLRLYRINEVPPGVNRDEAAIGYTAYSLIKTGKDEYGRPFPLSFQSFGDWKLPLYIYVTIPLVKMFGLTELAVRLPSALAGIATVGLTYFLILELFWKLEIRNLKLQAIALLSALLLAVSPWHIHLSRVESESNLAVLFTIVALLFFFKGIKRPVFFLGSALFFALTYYTYHGNHVTTTLFIVGLVVLFRSVIPKRKEAFAAIGLFIILVSFILSQTLKQADKTKLSGISIFGNPAVIHEKIEIPRNRYPNPSAWYIRLRYNRVTFAIETIMKNYISSFSPEFLFIRGGTNRAHNIQNFGNLYPIDAPFFYLGIILVFLGRKKQPMQLLLWWFLISPIAASITKDAPHTNRMFAIYPLPPILIALGIQKFLEVIPKKLYLLGVIGLIGLYSLNVGMYLNRYFIQFPKNEAQYWGKIYADLSLQLSSPELMDKKVIISHPEYSPYIFFLFYSKFDPKRYQETSLRYPPTEDAFVHVKVYDRFTFREIDWDKDIYQLNTVLVDFTKDVPPTIQGNRLSIFTLIEIP